MPRARAGRLAIVPDAPDPIEHASANLGLSHKFWYVSGIVMESPNGEPLRHSTAAGTIACGQPNRPIPAMHIDRRAGWRRHDGMILRR